MKKNSRERKPSAKMQEADDKSKRKGRNQLSISVEPFFEETPRPLKKSKIRFAPATVVPEYSAAAVIYDMELLREVICPPQTKVVSLVLRGEIRCVRASESCLNHSLKLTKNVFCVRKSTRKRH